MLGFTRKVASRWSSTVQFPREEKSPSSLWAPRERKFQILEHKRASGSVAKSGIFLMGEPPLKTPLAVKNQEITKKKVETWLYKKSAENKDLPIGRIGILQTPVIKWTTSFTARNDLTLTMPATSVNSRPTGDRRRLIGHCWLKTEHEWRWGFRIFWGGFLLWRVGFGCFWLVKCWFRIPRNCNEKDILWRIRGI